MVPFVMQRNTVEAEEGVGNLITWRGQATVKRNALQLRAADIYALALLHVAEVERVDSTSGVGHDRGLHVTDQSPLGGPEERVSLDIGGTRTGTKTACLVLDQ